VEKPLWAPWRMEFIQAAKAGGCIFCDFPAEAGEEADRRNLPAEPLGDLTEELARALAVVKRVYRPEGMNVGMNLGQVAGAGIADHLHWHVVPRWKGDTNFMPVIADLRVVPEALAEAWARLRAGFAG
jgi:ATP adenylyltransferase